MAEKFETYVHPDGREWTPSSVTERTNLIAKGWAPKPAGGAKSAKQDRAGAAPAAK